MCRWLERDPAGYQDGPSLYSYLGQNPMAGTDPSGRWVNIVGGAVIGAAIGGIAAAIDGEGWDGIARNAAKGAVVGAVAGATFGIGLAAAGVTTTATVAAAGGLSGMAATATEAFLDGRVPTAEELVVGIVTGLIAAPAGTAIGRLLQQIWGGARGWYSAGLHRILGKRTAQPGSVPRPGMGGGTGTAADLVAVARWGRPGLRPGDWVMPGQATGLRGLVNYFLSFKWQPGAGNRFSPFRDGETFQVPRDSLRWPSGWGLDGWWKGLFGQRRFQPDNSVRSTCRNMAD